jgi:hypothetical protein
MVFAPASFKGDLRVIYLAAAPVTGEALPGPGTDGSVSVLPVAANCPAIDEV